MIRAKSQSARLMSRSGSCGRLAQLPAEAMTIGPRHRVESDQDWKNALDPSWSSAGRDHRFRPHWSMRRSSIDATDNGAWSYDDRVDPSHRDTAIHLNWVHPR